MTYFVYEGIENGWNVENVNDDGTVENVSVETADRSYDSVLDKWLGIELYTNNK